MASLGSILSGIHAPKPPKIPKPTGSRTVVQNPKPPAPSMLGGRYKPPTTPTGTGTGTGTTPQMNFEAWYKTDPRYKMQAPQFDAARAQTYAQYGWHPVLDAAGKPTFDAQGHVVYRQATGSEDPFSIVNQLANALAGRSQQIQDSANSRGLLFSGAQAQMQQNAATEGDQKLSDAQLAFQNALRGINTNEADLVNTLYPDYLAQAPPASATTAKTTTTAATPDAAAKEADRQARIKKAQDHLRQDKINAQRRLKPPARKRKTTPQGKSTTIGSGAASMGNI